MNGAEIVLSAQAVVALAVFALVCGILAGVGGGMLLAARRSRRGPAYLSGATSQPRTAGDRGAGDPCAVCRAPLPRHEPWCGLGGSGL